MHWTPNDTGRKNTDEFDTIRKNRNFVTKDRQVIFCFVLFFYRRRSFEGTTLQLRIPPSEESGNQCCRSKIIEFGSGSRSRILAQCGSGSGSRVIQSLKEKIKNNFSEQNFLQKKFFLQLNYKNKKSPKEIFTH